MPIVHSGNHVCEGCRKSFEWKFFQMSRNRVEAIPESIAKEALVHAFEPNYKGGYSVAVNCPYCDHDNFFTFNEE